MNLFCDKKILKLIKEAEEQGFILERGKKSYKLYPPDKTKDIVVVALTPSDNNLYWKLRRLLKKSGFIVGED